jgi:hypothetical protein
MSLKLNSSGGGSVTLQEPVTASNVTLDLPATAGTIQVSGAAISGTTGTFSGAVQASGIATNLYPLVVATAQASTSGSSISFTGIPSWVERITVMFNGVSVNGSAIVYIRVGTSSGATTSGYLGAAIYINTGSATQASTYWPVDGASLGATATRHGNCVITNVTGNTWSMSGSVSNSNDTGVSVTNGGIPLAAALDRVLIEVSAGAFDAGSINILYE